MNMEKTGKFIAELRREKKMTQKDLGEKLLITDKAISKWERGVASPDISLLIPLAEILGVTTTELLNGERCLDFSPSFAENALLETIEIFEASKQQVKARLIFRYAIILLMSVLLIIGLYRMHSISTQWASLSLDLASLKESFVSQEYSNILISLDGDMKYDDYLYISHTTMVIGEKLRHMDSDKITLLRSYPDVIEVKNDYSKKNYLLYYTLLESSEIFADTVTIKPENKELLYSLISENIIAYNDLITTMENVEKQLSSNIMMKLYLSLRNLYF